MAGVTPRLKRKSTKRKYRYDDDEQDKIPQTQIAKVLFKLSYMLIHKKILLEANWKTN